MKFIIILCLILNCQTIHTGKFYETKNNKISLIERNKKYEIVTLQNGMKAKYSIKWQSHCVYEKRLIQVALPNKSFVSVRKKFESSYYSVKIISIEKDFYISQKKFYVENKLKEKYFDTTYFSKKK